MLLLLQKLLRPQQELFQPQIEPPTLLPLPSLPPLLQQQLRTCDHQRRSQHPQHPLLHEWPPLPQAQPPLLQQLLLPLRVQRASQ